MGLLRRTGRRAWLLAVAAAGSAALIATGTAAAQAAPRAAADQPVPPGIPGGFTTVLTTAGVGPAGGTIGPVTGGTLVSTVRVPVGDFPVAVDVTVTRPNLRDLAGVSHFGAYQPVAGVGVFVSLGGAKVTSGFTAPFSVRMADPVIRPDAVVVAWNGMRWVRVPAVVSAGVARVNMSHDPAYLVLNPLTSARRR